MDRIPAYEVPETGWKEVCGPGGNGRIVSLIHEDTQVLRRMAVFDVLVNNADRKGSHVPAMSGGHGYEVNRGAEVLVRLFQPSTSVPRYTRRPPGARGSRRERPERFLAGDQLIGHHGVPDAVQER